MEKILIENIPPDEFVFYTTRRHVAVLQRIVMPRGEPAFGFRYMDRVRDDHLPNFKFRSESPTGSIELLLGDNRPQRTLLCGSASDVRRKIIHTMRSRVRECEEALLRFASFLSWGSLDGGEDTTA